MTSFFTKTFYFVPHLPETITAVLASSRPLMNCSAVPVLLSDDDLMRLLKSSMWSTVQSTLIKLFADFSDTMQFSEKLDLSACNDGNYDDDVDFGLSIFKDLIENKRYFTRTVSSISFNSIASLELCCKKKMLNLRSINLIGCSSAFEDKHLKLICENLHLLRKLSLAFLNISDEAIQSVANLSSSLEELDLLVLENVSDLSFLKHLKQLQKLSVSGCRKVSEASFGSDDHLSPSSITTLGLPFLTQVGIESDPLDPENPPLRSISNLAPNLTSLDVAGVSDEGYEGISQMFHLRRLVLYKCKPLVGDVFKTVVMNLKYLQELEVRQTAVDEAFFETLSQAPFAASLRSLSVRDPPPLNNNNNNNNNTNHQNQSSGGIVTNEALKCLTCLLSLETLELVQVPAVGEDDDNVSSICNGEIGSSLNDDKNTTTNTSGDVVPDPSPLLSPSLKNLCFSHGFTRNITDRGLIQLLQPLSSLERLYLFGCGESVTAEGLRSALASSKSTLERLHVTHNSASVTNLCFLEGLPQLKSLSIEALRGLDFAAMRGSRNSDTSSSLDLLASSPLLEELDLAFTSVEDGDVINLPSTLVDTIKYLHVDDCLQLTDTGLIEGIGRLKLLMELTATSWRAGNAGKMKFTPEGVCSSVGKLKSLVSLTLETTLHSAIADDDKYSEKMKHLIS